MSASMVGSPVTPRRRPADNSSDSDSTTKNFPRRKKSRLEIKKQDAFKEFMVSAIIKHGCVLNLFGQGGNMDVFEYLNLGVKSISTGTVKEHCWEVYNREKQKLKQALGSIPGGVCVTCDVWTSPMTKEHCCLTVNYVDCDWKLQSKVLNLCPLPYPYDMSVLQMYVSGLSCQWGIEKKILSITFDGKRCGDIVHSHDGSQLCTSDSFHIPCAAHFMDIMVQECFKVIDSSIGKIRKGVQYVVENVDLSPKFEDAAKCIGFDQGVLEPLWLDFPVRWNSTYLMLERALQYREAFAYVMIEDTFMGWHLKDEEWSKVEKICKLLKPLCEIANLFMGTEHPTANLFFMHVWKTGMCLLEAMKDEDLEICNLAQRMKMIFDEYWESSNSFLALAIIFDPRYKLRSLNFCYQKLDEASEDNKISCIRSQLDGLFKAYAEEWCSKFPESDPMLKGFKKFAMEEAFKSNTSELHLYLKESRLNCLMEFDVLSWWKQNQDRFPVLANMARDILSIPISGFSKDSVFGMGYRVQVRWLSSPVLTQALVTSCNWLHGYQVDEDFPGGLMGLKQKFCA